MLIKKIDSSILFDICVSPRTGVIPNYEVWELTSWSEVCSELNKIINNFPAYIGHVYVIGYEKIRSELDFTKIILVELNLINCKTCLNILKEWFGDRILEI